ncbi:hypothetical protein [Curtobacterium flaccumfaciens]|uniref:hypothetical protein n=1 Tax=Curtobacterium flaccumfaciens TaxID=2035 RepID=UPI001BDFCEC1|nr:hypothetical protein [Curtobacterium flaccumfaciens]MBT1583236.1 hypothetical protein [Curtobacterium flaccumfaciens pv. flaccumfaciens]MCX2799567.1 hypothetical protein [Curtobacterium flaccumfaciens pv. flaccumfaciens]
MDLVSANVLGSVALVFGVVFVSTSILRLTRADVDLLLTLLNMALGILWIGAGVWLRRFGLRKTNGDR